MRDVAVFSPDGQVRLRVFPDDAARLRWAVTFGDHSVIEASAMALLVDGVDLAEGCAVGEAEPFSVRETYPWRGVHSRAVHHANGIALALRHNGGTEYRLEMRACDDGVAFRWVVPGDPERARVPDEDAAFALPAGSVVWYHGLERGHYEGAHVRQGIAEVPPGAWAAPPLTFRLPGDAGYAAITEAALANYSGMALESGGDGIFRLRLGHRHPPSYPFTLRYGQEEAERLAAPAAVVGEIVTPWRVVLIGADLNVLVNSDIVPSLCPPPDAELFPDGPATEWIRPGRAVWKYLDGGENTLEGMKEFTRLAGELGFEHNVVEGFWQRWDDAEVREMVEYGRERGVGIWLWKHSRELRDPHARRAFFARCRDLGAAGVKIDFFDHEHREIIDLYQALLRETAEHRLMVNFHGANKPTGESRTWPHELVREAVLGMEYRRFTERARHETTLPFTRLLAGHADYTPVHFGERRGDTTAAHQIASAVILGAPLLTYAAHPATLRDHPAAALIRSIPTVWDETIVLPLSEIGEIAAFARRAGETWFLAVLNGPTGRTIRVSLDFLAEGTYGVALVRDSGDDAAVVGQEAGMVWRDDTFTLDVRPGGGFLARFSR